MNAPSDRTGQQVYDEMDDLEVLTRYLNQQLDPQKVAIVARRLEEDAEYREWAAPLLLAWSIPPEWKRNPMPREEVERRWDEFTKRAGFIHQKRKARRRWMWRGGLLLLALGVLALAQYERIEAWWVDHRDYMEYVWRDPADWMPLSNGALVKPEPGARIRLRRQGLESVVPASGSREAQLERLKVWGTVHIRALPPVRANELLPGMQPVSVTTNACVVVATHAEFTVSARGDTTDVMVHVPSTRAYIGFVRLPTTVMVGRPTEPGEPENLEPITVREGRGVRCIETRRLTGMTSSIEPLP